MLIQLTPQEQPLVGQLGMTGHHLRQVHCIQKGEGIHGQL